MWSLPRLLKDKRQGTRWTSRHFITELTQRDGQLFTLTFTLMANLDKQANRHVFGLWEGKHANSTQIFGSCYSLNFVLFPIG